MHLEVLVEDASASIALAIILEKMLGPNGGGQGFRLHSYRGIGRLPKDLKSHTDPAKRILLDRLPHILRGYGNSLRDHPNAAVVVVVDSDDRACLAFKHELTGVLDGLTPRPTTLFRIAIEEVEAWLRGDEAAVVAAYPAARRDMLGRYIPDSICGTWEVLADAVVPGGAASLVRQGWAEVGRAKCAWAAAIAPHLDLDRTRRPSFRVFLDGVRRLAGVGPA